MKEFIEIPEIGFLRYDKILFEMSYPILFTCTDDEQKLYLCVCCQHNSEGIKWLITRTTPSTIISVLENVITLREAFLKFSDIRISVLKKDGVQYIERNDCHWDVDSKYLPDEGVFIDAEEGEFEEEIIYYKKQLEREYLSIELSTELFSEIAEECKTVLEEFANSIKSIINHSINMEMEMIRQILDISIDTCEINDEIIEKEFDYSVLVEKEQMGETKVFEQSDCGKKYEECSELSFAA